MKITPTILTIQQILSSSNEQFHIPAYQRRYSWQFEQLANLFDDIDTLKKGEAHLLGSIVCLAEGHTAGINRLEVVDGQQRLTSITILLLVLKERFEILANPDFASDIEKFLNCRNFDGKKDNKVVLGDLDNPDFQYLLKNKLEKMVNINLKEAYEYFTDWVADLNEERLNRFYFNLISNVSVMRLDVLDARDAYKLFETINNRGLRLSHTDIIKNFILGHASTISTETLNVVRENWKNLIVNLDGVNIDTFFRQLMIYHLKHKISSSKTIDLFRKHYIENVIEAENLADYYLFNEVDETENEDESVKSFAKKQSRSKVRGSTNKIDIECYSENLNRLSKTYGNIINQRFLSKKINAHLFNLERIRSVPSYILLVDLFQRGIPDDKMIDILKALEVFMLRRHICAKRTSELDDLFAKMVGIDSADIVSAIKENFLLGLPKDSEFEEMICKHDFYRQHDRAKYILEYIEYDLISSKDEYTINSGNDVHLEHVVPQVITTKKSKKDFGDWEIYLGKKDSEKHPKFVNRLGNFTLLARELNIIASNNPYLDKLEEYKKSNLKITKDIVKNYSEFKFNDVEMRSEELAKLAVKIWKF